MVAVSVVMVERFCALLAIIAGSGAVILLIARLVPGGEPLIDAVRPLRLWLAWLVAAVAMAGSLYFSETANFAPCKMCWFQRIAMYPLAVLLLVAAIRRDFSFRIYAIILATIGGLISTYHYVIEWHPSLGSGACDISAPCTVPWFRQFGFISLPLMALCGFAAMVSLLAIGEVAEQPADSVNEVS
jgi:uncharacterized membrane protein (UPF0136 family)